MKSTQSLPLLVLGLLASPALAHPSSSPNPEVQKRAPIPPFTCLFGKVPVCCEALAGGVGDLPSSTGVLCKVQPPTGCPDGTTAVACCTAVVRLHLTYLVFGLHNRRAARSPHAAGQKREKRVC